MAEVDGQEKTEQASGKKLQEARDRGQVAKSIEINSLVIFTSGLMILYIAQSHIASQLSTLATKIFSSLDILDINKDMFSNYSITGLSFYLFTLGPLFFVLMVAGFISNVSQVGFSFSTKALKPKPEKLNPLQGIKKVLISSQSMIEVTKSLLKLGVIGFFTYNVLDGLIKEATTLAEWTVSETLEFMVTAAYSLVWKIAMVFAVFAGVDFIFQRHKFKKDMMMTKQEVKEENKQAEGDPQIKSRIRKVQFTMANKRMMQNIPQADVVITNPTHFAIALKYDLSKDAAPKVIAKGMDSVAMKIKEIAKKHNIYMHEDRELARALYKSCEIGDSIPASLFKAVAQILAYIYQLKNVKKRKQIV